MIKDQSWMMAEYTMSYFTQKAGGWRTHEMCFDKKKITSRGEPFCRQRKTSGKSRTGDFIGDLMPRACGAIAAWGMSVPGLNPVFPPMTCSRCKLSHAHATTAIASLYSICMLTDGVD